MQIIGWNAVNILKNIIFPIIFPIKNMYLPRENYNPRGYMMLNFDVKQIILYVHLTFEHNILQILENVHQPSISFE